MKYYSSGKLLLTSEYMVLAGSLCLSLPTKLGQTMEVNQNAKNTISWKSFDNKGELWFSNEFKISDLEPTQSKNPGVEMRLTKLLSYIKKNGSIDFDNVGYAIETHLQFDRNWGLGSSSTLVANLAKWADVDGIDLLHSAFQGSGYDVATGIENETILYQLLDKPTWRSTVFNPSFSDELYFVYLGRKQNSEVEVNRFNKNTITKSQKKIFTDFTNSILTCTTINSFEQVLTEHEQALSNILHRQTIKEERFEDYPRSIKSLGAWGGDFILVTGDEESQTYFKNKGYDTIVPWHEMIHV